MGGGSPRLTHAHELRRVQARLDRDRVESLRTELTAISILATVVEAEVEMGDRDSAARSLAHADECFATLVRYLSDPNVTPHIGAVDREKLEADVGCLRETLDGLKRRRG